MEGVGMPWASTPKCPDVALDMKVVTSSCLEDWEPREGPRSCGGGGEPVPSTVSFPYCRAISWCAFLGSPV